MLRLRSTSGLGTGLQVNERQLASGFGGRLRSVVAALAQHADLFKTKMAEKFPQPDAGHK